MDPSNPEAVNAWAGLTKEVGVIISLFFTALATIIPAILNSRKTKRVRAAAITERTNPTVLRTHLIEALEQRMDQLRDELEETKHELRGCREECQRHRQADMEKDATLAEQQRTIQSFHLLMRQLDPNGILERRTGPPPSGQTHPLRRISDFGESAYDVNPTIQGPDSRGGKRGGN